MRLFALKAKYPESYAALKAVAGDHKLEYLGQGCSRAVYRVVGRNLVLKVLVGDYAQMSNLAERDLWRGLAGHSARARLAPCRMLNDMVLAMVLVGDRGICPEWARPVDCGQGGEYHGRWVLYDYGHELYRYPDGLDSSVEKLRSSGRSWIAEVA
jgi:hypothetical protein